MHNGVNSHLKRNGLRGLLGRRSVRCRGPGGIGAQERDEAGVLVDVSLQGDFTDYSLVNL